MKKIFSKAISILLAALMLFSASAVLGFAAEPTVPVPTISIDKVSETKTQVVISVALAENGLSSLDLTITSDDDLALTSIESDDDLRASFESNIDTGMISLANTKGLSAPQNIAQYTYTKKEAAGIVDSDFTIEITACYVEIEVDGETVGEDVFESAIIKNNIPTAHTHIADGGWAVTSPASCGAEGTEVRYCAICGQVAEERAIAKLEHTNTAPEHLDATCTVDGYDKIFCNDCKQYISETVIPATGHKDTHTERTEPTCTVDGVEKVVCACGEVISETILPKTEHTDTHTERTEPTCTVDGVEKVVCACGEVVSSTVIPATGHKDTHIERTEPTCTVDGVEKVVCACGDIVSSTVIPATGHKDTHLDKKAATCTEDGYIKTICACGEVTEIKILQATGHKFIVDIRPATCTEDGYTQSICPACGMVEYKSIAPATDHAWLAWETIKQPTYASAGIERQVCGKCGADHEREIPKLTLKATELIIKQEITMNFKQTARLFVSILPEEAAYSAEIIWESSDESVATVDEDGAIYAAGLGTATITAKTADGSVEATCQVTVNYSIIQWIIVYILFGWIWYV